MLYAKERAKVNMDLVELESECVVFLEKQKCPNCAGILIKSGVAYTADAVVFYRTGWECQKCGKVYVEGIPDNVVWEQVLSTGLWTLKFEDEEKASV